MTKPSITDIIVFILLMAGLFIFFDWDRQRGKIKDLERSVASKEIIIDTVSQSEEKQRKNREKTNERLSEIDSLFKDSDEPMPLAIRYAIDSLYK